MARRPGAGGAEHEDEQHEDDGARHEARRAARAVAALQARWRGSKTRKEVVQDAQQAYEQIAREIEGPCAAGIEWPKGPGHIICKPSWEAVARLRALREEKIVVQKEIRDLEETIRARE